MPSTRRTVTKSSLFIALSATPLTSVLAVAADRTLIIKLSPSYRKDSLVVSSDAGSAAFVEANDGGERVVQDGRAGPTFSRCAQPIFAPNSKNAYYWALQSSGASPGIKLRGAGQRWPSGALQQPARRPRPSISVPQLLRGGATTRIASRRSSRQGTNTHPPRLDHQQVTDELVRMGGGDIGYQGSLRCIRQAVQREQDHPTDSKPLANDQFAKIAILGNQDAPLPIRGREHLFIRSPCPRCTDGHHIEAGRSKALDDEM